MFSKSSMRSDDIFTKTHGGFYSNFQTSILSIVKSQIIPGLLEANRNKTRHLSLIFSSRAIPSQKEVEIFVDLCVSQDPKISLAFVNHFLNDGLSTEDIFIDLITPAARYFGSQWDDGRMDFSQVNLGLIRLHAIANEIGFAHKDGPSSKGKVYRVIIASAPGSEHMLGTAVVADFFRKEDWQVVVAISSSANKLIQTVSNEWFDVIGLSVSIEHQLTNLADLIDQFKRTSLNPHVVILLGGPIFVVKEFRASDFGAGEICVNAKHAVGLALSLLQN